MLCNKKRKCSKVLHIVTRKNLQIYLNVVFISSTFTKKIGLGDASLASFNASQYEKVILRRIHTFQRAAVLRLDTNNEACLQLREDTGRPTCVVSSNVFLPPKDQTPLPPGLTQRLRLTSEEFIAPGLGALHKYTTC